MNDSIEKIQTLRDAQQKQFNEDTKGWSSLDRINNIYFILKVENFIKGLDKALEILKTK